MKRFLIQIIIGILGIYLATLFVPGVKIEGGEFTPEGMKILLFSGLALGIANFILKPVLDIITLPLRIITFGLSGLIVDMAIIWLVNIFFPELVIPHLSSLFWTALIVSILNLFLLKRKKRRV